MIRPLSFQGKKDELGIDPAPGRPDFVRIDTPEALLYVSNDKLKDMIMDLSEDALIFAPYRPGDFVYDSLCGFVDKVIDAIRYEKSALASLEAMLKTELMSDLDADYEVFDRDIYSHESLISRAGFRHRVAYAIYTMVKGNALYSKGYLFYNVAQINTSGIILVKIKLESRNLV